MATKNFLFLPFWMGALLTLASCAQVKPRAEEQQPRFGNPQPPLVEVTKNNTIEVAEPLPAVVQKSRPRIGLILGPGGIKTFSQLGFLEQFEKARIPIEFVSGLEWGAMVAGFYSVQGKAYDAQWKMLKMTEKDLPSGGIFDSQLRMGRIESLQRFLATTLSSHRIERSTLPFSCPAQSTQSGHLRWLNSGVLSQVLQYCVPYPPLFTPHDNLSAAPFALREAAENLRRQGANVVMLVDVLADGGLMSAKSAQDNYPLYLLWLSIQNQMRGSRGVIVDEVFSINTREQGLSDFAARRNLIQAGQSAGKEAVQYLTKKYGL